MMRATSILGTALILGAGLLAGGAASADAIACLKKGKKIVIRQDGVCRADKEEEPLAEHAAALGLRGPRAYGAVAGGSAQLFSDFGIDSVRRAATGVYCVTPEDPTLDPRDVPAVVSPELNGTNQPVDLNVVVYTRAPFVCQDDEFEVLTVVPNAASPNASKVDLSNDHGFTIIIP